MRSPWTTNSTATDRVKVLLEQAGIPLELQVAEVCRHFCTSHAGAENVHLSSEKMIYSPTDTSSEHREVDQIVQIYEEIKVEGPTGLQFIVHIPIECKYRKDLEAFAFAAKNEKLHKRFPIHGDHRGSRYFRSLLKSFTPFEAIEPSYIVGLKIEEGSTPQKVHDENLVYNAAGSLYDFIYFDLTMDTGDISEQASKIIDELGVFK